MFEIGTKQTLQAVKQVKFGMYYAEEGNRDKDAVILLPEKQIPEGTKVGDMTELFIYRDSSDRLIATTNTPKLMKGQIARLHVANVTGIGAFLDWGLEKDLFLPFKEQTYKVSKGDDVLVSLYVDKSGRLCATMKLYHYLEKGGEKYAKDDWVEGTLYEISDNFGAFVAVDDRYSGLIPKREFVSDIKVGSHVKARITKIHDDGKIDLSIREKANMQIAVDASKLVDIIESFDGVLPFTDKASPETIKRETGMSKNEFKRAVGNLLKSDRIEITEKSIRLK